MASTVEPSVYPKENYCKFKSFGMDCTVSTTQAAFFIYAYWRSPFSSLGLVPSMHSFQAQAWRTLFCLTAPGRLSFHTFRSLRSGTFHDWEIYALHRLAGHLEQPIRGHARKLSSKTMIILQFECAWTQSSIVCVIFESCHILF